MANQSATLDKQDSKENKNLLTPTDLKREGVVDIAEHLRRLLADAFVLYIKTKNFHWHMSGRHFRDYHLLLDEQAAQIFAITDDIAERSRKIGETTLHSASEIIACKRIKENTADFVAPQDMLAELHADNLSFVKSLREAHEVADDNDDSATTSMIELWIDEAERRAWFLFETIREV